MINVIKVIEIFCQPDDFMKVFKKHVAGEKLIGASNPKSVHKPRMSYQEMMCIEIVYHLSGYKCFRYYYENVIENGVLKGYFKSCSYSRFVQLKPRMALLMPIYLFYSRLGHYNGIYYADSTKIAVCHNKRIHSNKVFSGMASRGKTSVGWFYGWKLFMVVNHLGQLINVKLSQANKADNSTDLITDLFARLKGWAFADKGFINKKAMKALFDRGLHLVTRSRKNMKNKLMNMKRKLLLNKRGIIESAIAMLKGVCDIEHTRHRSPLNAFLNVFAALTAYTFLDRLPSACI